MFRKITSLFLFFATACLVAESAEAQQPIRNVFSNGPVIQSSRSPLRGMLTPIREPGVFAAIVRPAGAPTGWYPYVIAREQDRDCLRSTPIELRPYRPLHFYGNAVRRSIHR